MAGVRWERLAPSRPCSSPDGHVHFDIVSAASDIPIRSYCQNCGHWYSILMLPAESAATSVQGGTA